MAENSEGMEKQHQASSKHLDELRKQGQTLRSRDLASGLVLFAIVIVLIYISGHLAERFSENFVMCFTSIKTIMNSDELPRNFFMHLAIDNFLVLVPIFIVAMLAPVLSLFIFGGWSFSFESLGFNLAKLNPISNLKNIFSINILINIGKSLLKVSIIVSILVTFILSRLKTISGLMHLPLSKSLPIVNDMVQDYVFAVVMALTLIVLYDIIHQFFQYQNKTKMTTQEVKDEHKDSEGNSDVKRKMKSMQFSLLKQRLNILVPRANVIITNPTHYAVAIKYDSNKDFAPRVIAKGKGYIALQIKQLAMSNSIPIYEAPDLARAVFHTTKLGAEINPGLYMSVAIVLSYVNQLKNFQQGAAPQRPMYVSDLRVPQEFIYHE